jgi:TrmH family RNA methyltransferase
MPEPGKTPPAPAHAHAAHVRIVLVRTSHPGNIGAAARAMKTMGLTQLVLVDPALFPNAMATARAAGADDILATARVVATLDEAIADCAWVVATSARTRRIGWPEVDARGFAQQALERSSVAVVFGREDSGLSNQDLDRCHALLRLDTNPLFASLNLAAAVQVVAYELRMAGVGAVARAPHDAAQDVTQAEMEGFYTHLEQALVEIGFHDPLAPRLLPRRLRRMFNRMAPDRTELNILRGILAAARKSARR